jgi:hypothetical protein
MKFIHSQSRSLKVLFGAGSKKSLLLMAVLISLSATAANHIYKTENEIPRNEKPSSDQKKGISDDEYEGAMSTSGKVTFIYNVSDRITEKES